MLSPQEAELMDPASNQHIRFRFAGTSFPPRIYYKIFVSGTVVDLNSFSPRGYFNEKRIETFSKSINKPVDADLLNASPFVVPMKGDDHPMKVDDRKKVPDFVLTTEFPRKYGFQGNN